MRITIGFIIRSSRENVCKRKCMNTSNLWFGRNDILKRCVLFTYQYGNFSLWNSWAVGGWGSLCVTSNRRWKVTATSVPQGHRTAGWEAAGDEPHAPRGPAGALQRPPGRTEAHGAQLVGAPRPPRLHPRVLTEALSWALVFKSGDLNYYLELDFSHSEQWCDSLENNCINVLKKCICKVLCCSVSVCWVGDAIQPSHPLCQVQ